MPARIDVTPGSNGGKDDEKKRLRTRLEADHCYVMDRWYAQFTFWNDIVVQFDFLHRHPKAPKPKG